MGPRIIPLAVLLLVLVAGSARAADTVSDGERQRLAMLEAAVIGDVSAINRLIVVGTKVDVADEVLRTPLYLAVENNRLEAVKLLLSEGADINAQARDFETPWLLAASLNRADMLRLMIPHKPDFTTYDRFGSTALNSACERGHVEAVRVLLSTPLDVNHVNNLGWTCLLEIAYIANDSPRHNEISKLVLASGANPYLADKKGRTPLAHALARKLPTLAALLRAAGGR